MYTEAPLLQFYNTAIYTWKTWKALFQYQRFNLIFEPTGQTEQQKFLPINL